VDQFEKVFDEHFTSITDIEVLLRALRNKGAG
jgi:hypothetical protein